MNKVALITGASSGIGLALAKEFARKGHDLVLVARNKEKLREIQGNLQQQNNIEVQIIAIDLCQDNACVSIMKELTKKRISISFLVNNAGFNEVEKFKNTRIEKEKEMIQLHTVFVTELIKALLPDMLQQRFGRILNICSTGSYIPTPYNAVYTATKAYLLFLSKSLSMELAGSGIGVTAISPGATKTQFAEKASLEHSLLFKLFVLDSNTVARVSYKKMIKKKPTYIVGNYNKLLVLTSRILPNSIVNFMSKKMLNIS